MNNWQASDIMQALSEHVKTVAKSYKRLTASVGYEPPNTAHNGRVVVHFYYDSGFTARMTFLHDYVFVEQICLYSPDGPTMSPWGHMVNGYQGIFQYSDPDLTKILDAFVERMSHEHDPGRNQNGMSFRIGDLKHG